MYIIFTCMKVDHYIIHQCCFETNINTIIYIGLDPNIIQGSFSVDIKNIIDELSTFEASDWLYIVNSYFFQEWCEEIQRVRLFWQHIETCKKCSVSALCSLIFWLFSIQHSFIFLVTIFWMVVPWTFDFPCMWQTIYAFLKSIWTLHQYISQLLHKHDLTSHW